MPRRSVFVLFLELLRNTLRHSVPSVVTSDRMVRLLLFRDRISNCTILSRTEPDTGYSHLLDCSSVTYRGRNAAHIHLPFDDVTYNIDQTLELTVMSIVCSIVILYAKYLAKTLPMARCRNQKCIETGPKRCCSVRNSTNTRSSTVSSSNPNWSHFCD